MIVIEIPKQQGERTYSPLGCPRLVIPLGTDNYIIAGADAEALLKDSDTMNAIRAAHAGVIVRGLPHEEVIETPLVNDKAHTPETEHAGVERKAPSGDLTTTRKALPKIARATTEGDLADYLKSDSKTIREAAEKKLESLRRS